MKIGSKTARLVTGLIVGSIAGAAVGMIVAPRTGKETRHLVRHKTGHYVGALRERFGGCGATNGAKEHSAAHVEVAS